jgi:HAD superfamily hydrolase (TIGR01509 family)
LNPQAHPTAAPTAASASVPSPIPLPKAIIFDLGKVLLDFDYGIAARTLAPRTRIGETAIRGLLDQSPLLHEFESGKISAAELYATFVKESGFTGSLADFRAAFGDIFTEIPSMIAMHAELRAAGLPTHILSNTNDIAVEHIQQRFPFFAGFTSYIFSHEVGAMKPKAPIYEALERSAGFTGTDLLYIDDRSENIDAAIARNWQCILHHDPAATVAEVWRRLGR